MKRLIQYILPLLLLLPLLNACSEETGTHSGEEKLPQTEARFELQIKEAGSTTATRATDESAINSLKLFVVPLDDQGNEIRNSNDIYVLDPVSQTPGTDGTVTATFVSLLPTGKKHLYAAANITAVQAGNIRNNWKYTLNSINNSEVVSPLTTGGIAMWQQVLADDGSAGTPDIEIVTNLGIVSSLKPVILERVVAKVVLTVQADAQGYVPLTKSGWMKQDDVRYALDKTAKAFGWTKPATAGNVQSEGVTTIVSYQEHNGPEWYKSQAPQSNPDNYTVGIYCLENPAGETEEQGNATRMVIAAQYIPATLWIANGNTVQQRTYTTVDEAIAAINSQKDPAAADKTYWSYTDGSDTRFYTHQAYDHVKGNMNLSNFSKHNAGWGYYQTLVNGTIQNGQPGIKWDREKSVIHRNTRHILKITRFNPPGSGEMNAVDFDENIYVYATVEPWNDKGGTNNDLEFNEAEQNKPR